MSFNYSNLMRLAGVALLNFVGVNMLWAAKGADGMEYDLADVGGASYSLECKWMIPDIAEITEVSKSTYRTNIFYYQGAVYLNIQYKYSKPELEKFDAITGESLGSHTIDWNGYEYSSRSAVYAGIDSDGEPYVASFGGPFAEGAEPFCIYPIEFTADGTPTAAGRYELELLPHWYNGSPSVKGSVKSGHFSVAASVRDLERISDVYQRPKTGVALWNVDSDKAAEIQAYADALLSVTLAIPLEDNHVLIYDRSIQIRGLSEDYKGAIPTIFEITSDHTLKPISTFDGHIDNEHGNGLTFFELNCVPLMAYSAGNFLPSYAIAKMNDYPQLENSDNLWKMSSDEFNRFSTCNNQQEGTMLAAVVAPDSSYADLYLLTNSVSLSSYRIEYQSGELTDIAPLTIADTDSSATYYTLQGHKLTQQPTSPGIYILRKGSKVTKTIIP
ncbi:MAG: hypothetical protein K2L84_03520 [Muribaculaceae bacterium]|nr:hypothetical protein [Muribaculaceae bacterium]